MSNINKCTVKTRLYKYSYTDETDITYINRYETLSEALKGFSECCKDLISFVGKQPMNDEFKYTGEVTLQPEGGEIIGHLNL